MDQDTVDASAIILAIEDSAHNLNNREAISLPNAEPSQAKDSPLTDIGTSPPPFDLPSLVSKRGSSKDSYESSELSDLGEDESEAETDKMDFLEDEASSGTGEKVSDLFRLSELTELARLQEVDSDDSDEELEDKRSVSEDFLALSVAGTTKRPLESDDEVKEQETDSKKMKILEEEEAASPTPEEDGETTVQSPTDEVEDLQVDADPSELIALEVETKTEPNGDDVAEENESEPNGQEVVLKTELEEEEEEEEDRIAEVIEKAPTHAIEAAVSEVMDEDGAEEGAEEGAEDGAEDGAEEEDDEESEEHDADFDEQRKQAVQELICIEEDFAHLRDKLYHDKLSLLEHELQLCLEGSHPELLQIYYKVNEFYQDNIKMANATLNYSLKCINNETLASRTSIHQDFMKNLMDMKNNMITETTTLWYKINRERNYLDQVVPDYNFAALPLVTGEDKSLLKPIAAGGSNMNYYLEGPTINKKVQKQNTLMELVRYRNGLNEQLGILNGLKEFHGIPCAVTCGLLEEELVPVQELLLRKATADEIDEDLHAMGILT